MSLAFPPIKCVCQLHQMRLVHLVQLRRHLQCMCHQTHLVQLENTLDWRCRLHQMRLASNPCFIVTDKTDSCAAQASVELKAAYTRSLRPHTQD